MRDGKGLATKTHAVAEFPDGLVGLVGRFIAGFLLRTHQFGGINISLRIRTGGQAVEVMVGSRQAGSGVLKHCLGRVERADQVVVSLGGGIGGLLGPLAGLVVANRSGGAR